MYYSGFADEAGVSVELQIEATKRLGWHHIDARNIDGVNIIDLPEKAFESVSSKLELANIKVSCFGSEVANWAKDPREEESFLKSVEELERAIPRMKKLGCKMIRGMSFAVPKNGLSNDLALEKTVLEKLKILVGMCEEQEIIYLHENCMNYFSQSYEHMDRLLEGIKSPFFKIVFDTGNPVMTPNRTKAPGQRQTTWEAYQHLKGKIHHIHIKDGRFVKETDAVFPEMEYTFPGKGDGQVEAVLTDLLSGGYDGGISIEPHLASVYHEDSDGNGQGSAQRSLGIYVEYGKRTMDLIDSIKRKLETKNKE